MAFPSTKMTIWFVSLVLHGKILQVHPVIELSGRYPKIRQNEVLLVGFTKLANGFRREFVESIDHPWWAIVAKLHFIKYLLLLY